VIRGFGQNLGALVERNFRLVFSAVTISGFGDGVSAIALVFAVLHISHESPVAVGIVLACRQGAAALITLAAGVIADRLPRHLVLVAVSLVQGTAQTAAGVLLISGHATVARLAILAVIYGLADGFVIPASQGLIPLIVSSSRLQQANALLGLSRSVVGFLGPTLGGLFVAFVSPGGGLIVDAATFFVAAVLLTRVHIPEREDAIHSERFFAEMKAGWNEFRRQTWIWTTIVFFGIGNFAGASLFVLGPIVALNDFNGARSWGLIVGSTSVGAILGGLVALRIRIKRQLLGSCIAAIPYGFQTLAIGLGLPLWALVLNGAFAGGALAVHLALWFTVFQQEVPEEYRSRVSSYDALGSFVLIPLGSALAGVVAAGIGVHTTLIVSGLISVGCILVVIAQPSVRRIGTIPVDNGFQEAT
jgi:MFS family permease